MASVRSALLPVWGSRSAFRAVIAAAFVFVSAAAASAAPVPPNQIADRTEPLPKRLAGVDVKERLGRNVPKSLGFVDQDGRRVLLGQYFNGALPVLLTFNYSDCPMLCSLMLNGLLKSLKEIDLTPGKDFQIVTVSIDHREKPERALRTKGRYLSHYGRPEATNGWHFLTGSAENVRAFADSIGFGYSYNEARDEYAHPSAFVLASPDGTLVRYLYGIEYEPKTVRMALVEASEGKIGTTLDRVFLYCFHYDSSEGRYAPVARNIMRLGGGASVVLLAGFLTVLFRNGSKKRRIAEGTAT
jgi:protein SCO1